LAGRWRSLLLPSGLPWTLRMADQSLSGSTNLTMPPTRSLGFH